MRTRKESAGQFSFGKAKRFIEAHTFSLSIQLPKKC